MSKFQNIKFYVLCRYKLKVSQEEIYIEIKRLFGMYIDRSISDSVKRWINAFENEIDFVKRDREYSYSRYNNFALDNLLFKVNNKNFDEPDSIQKKKFYALCRFQLRQCPETINKELNEIFYNDSIELIKEWIHDSWLNGKPVYYKLFNIKKNAPNTNLDYFTRENEMEQELKEMKLKNKELSDLITSQSMKFIEDTCLAKKYWEDNVSKLNTELNELKSLNSKLNCELYKTKSQLLNSIEQNNKAIKLENDLNQCMDKLHVMQTEYENQLDSLKSKRLDRNIRKWSRIKRATSKLVLMNRIKSREIFNRKLKFIVESKKKNAQYVIKHIKNEYNCEISNLRKQFRITKNSDKITEIGLLEAKYNTALNSKIKYEHQN
jgi:hypothetical protein